MLITIKVFSKNMALIKNVELETDAVPRIGEAIWLEFDGMDSDVSYLIHDVFYYVSEQRLSPVVCCHEATPNAHRKLVLEENGWL
jgi:hypothetical protein